MKLFQGRVKIIATSWIINFDWFNGVCSKRIIFFMLLPMVVIFTRFHGNVRFGELCGVDLSNVTFFDAF